MLKNIVKCSKTIQKPKIIEDVEEIKKQFKNTLY